MAQKPLLVLEAVDVRRATQTGTSRGIILKTLTIPPIKFVTAEHAPGGGVLTVAFGKRRLQALEPAFSVAGLDDDVFRGMGEKDTWTFASAYRDAASGKMVAARGVIEASVTQWEPDESDPAEMQGCNHMFEEVTHFEFTLDEKEWCYVDFFEREARFMGKSLFGPVRTALGG